MRRSHLTLFPMMATMMLTMALATSKVGKARADDVDTAVDLFEAIDAKDVIARFIPLSASKANVLITNNTDRVIHVQLPDAIAAVPVLAQFAQDGGRGRGQQGGGGAQGVGGGFPGGNRQGFGNQRAGNGGNNFQQGGQRNNFGGGLMRVEPQKTRKLVARTVCLEHGKPEPHPRIAYRLMPIAEFTDDTQVAELCSQLGRGEIEQATAQAVAWHLANGLSWQKLARINRMESKYLGNIPFFQSSEIKRARTYVESLNEPETNVAYRDVTSLSVDQTGTRTYPLSVRSAR